AKAGLHAVAMQPGSATKASLLSDLLGPLSESQLSDSAASVLGKEPELAKVPPKKSEPEPLVPKAPPPRSEEASRKAKLFVSTTTAWGGGSGSRRWSSTAGFKDSLTGQQISRSQAISELAKVQRESATRIMDSLTRTVEAVECADSFSRMVLLEKFDRHMDASREMLMQHSKGLLGSDLAELRMKKTERKVLLDKVSKQNRAYTMELSQLRDQLRSIDSASRSRVDRSLPGFLETSLQDFGRESQSCILSCVEQKLRAVFAQPLEPLPVKEATPIKQPSRLENSFLKERVNTLQQQVKLLEEQIANCQRQHAVLLAKKENMEEQLNQARNGDSSSVKTLSSSRASTPSWHGTPR
ncbi:unnamed protein product, partial [Effrenium voratum]